MDNEKRIPQEWNITQLAEAFSSTRPTVRKRLKSAGFLPVGCIAGVPVYLMADAARAMYQPAEFKTGAVFGYYDSPQQMSPRDRKDWFDSERSRMAAEKHAKNLVPAEGVRQGYADYYRAIVPPLDSLVDALKEIGLTGKAIELSQKQVDAIKEQMYLTAIKAGAELDSEEDYREDS
ncbi:DUF1441 family protein [Endozoicomonas arenosclerae]|uniref:DUF1441 family protein n=1 Tax=Endozoicomonas arenosclerae TaxID=1633495 RepID=UPI00078368DA|nr:DUF1441 family protein [Endozoicomonas arenosclerae]